MRGQGGSQAPAGQGMVAADVFAHPATSVGEIADRTGLRQSYVSESIARLREQGVVETSADPADGRRTLMARTAYRRRHQPPPSPPSDQKPGASQR
jgi:MarR family transcriptional regulator, 2-MHQ and catechol-resistance regulon repressor